MAERLAYHILHLSFEEIEELVNAILNVKSSVKFCKECYMPSDKDICTICSDETRDRTIVCVIENVKDLLAIERTKKYNGIYHIIGGSISPLDGLNAENLKIKELLCRINGVVTEIIVATNPTTDGDITANYIKELFKDKDIKITRIGYGMPLGGSLEYADEITLTHSLQSRKEL
jgi:recombination protein RecR